MQGKATFPATVRCSGFSMIVVIEAYRVATNRPIYLGFHRGWEVCQITDALLRLVYKGRWIRVEEV